ncbi:proton channel OtopLc-like [Glandiceps talaboti]
MEDMESSMGESDKIKSGELGGYATIQITDSNVESMPLISRHVKAEATVSKAFSELLATTLVVMSVVFVITVALNKDKNLDLPYDGVDWYYLFLYSTSILAMIVMRLKMIDRSANLPKKSGSSYVKVGATLFGICVMMLSGFKFAAILDGSYEDPNWVNATESVVMIIFVLAQMIFVSSYSDICINKWTTLARVGATVIWAANVSGWFRAYVSEITVEWKTQEEDMEKLHLCTCINMTKDHKEHEQDHFYNGVMQNLTSNTNPSSAYSFMDIYRISGEFLVPSAMEYDIIMAGIMYFFYTNIGTRSIEQGHPKMVMKNRSFEYSLCGFALGVVVLVTSVGIAIGYAIEAPKPNHSYKAESLYYGFLTVLYTMSIVACLFSLTKIYRSDWLPDDSAKAEKRLETSLLVFSSVGKIVHPLFVIMSALSYLDCSMHNAEIIIIEEVSIIIFVYLQVFFIYDILHRTPPQNKSNAMIVRQFVMFLIFANLTGWWTCFYEIKFMSAQPIQYCFYGVRTWSIILHLTIPLEIYFRFHSAILLLGIWESF